MSDTLGRPFFFFIFDTPLAKCIGVVGELAAELLIFWNDRIQVCVCMCVCSGETCNYHECSNHVMLTPGVNIYTHMYGVWCMAYGESMLIVSFFLRPPSTQASTSPLPTRFMVRYNICIYPLPMRCTLRSTFRPLNGWVLNQTPIYFPGVHAIVVRCAHASIVLTVSALHVPLLFNNNLLTP
jgi:hypothetical protein